MLEVFTERVHNNVKKIYINVFFINSKVISLIFCQFWTYSIFILKSAAFYEPLVAIGEDYTACQILLPPPTLQHSSEAAKGGLVHKAPTAMP